MIQVYQMDAGPGGIYFEVYEDEYDRDNYVMSCNSVQEVLDYADEVAEDFVVHTVAKYYKEND